MYATVTVTLAAIAAVIVLVDVWPVWSRRLGRERPPRPVEVFDPHSRGLVGERPIRLRHVPAGRTSHRPR